MPLSPPSPRLRQLLLAYATYLESDEALMEGHFLTEGMIFEEAVCLMDHVVAAIRLYCAPLNHPSHRQP